MIIGSVCENKASEKRISDNRTYGDILSNLLKYVYYPETLSIDAETLFVK